MDVDAIRGDVRYTDTAVVIKVPSCENNAAALGGAAKAAPVWRWAAASPVQFASRKEVSQMTLHIHDAKLLRSIRSIDVYYYPRAVEVRFQGTLGTRCTCAAARS